MTSTSARRMASAIASQPVRSCSVSTSWIGTVLTATAIYSSPPAAAAAALADLGGAAETPLVASNQALYLVRSFSHSWNLSSLSENLSSSTMTMQSLTGQTCAQMPQPMHAS